MAKHKYITPEEYAIAEANGIGHKNVDRRVRGLDWSIERAITEELNISEFPKEIRELAKANGIGMKTLATRIYRDKLDHIEAATKPLMPREESLKKAQNSRRKYDPKMVALAKENGIDYSTFQKRVRLRKMTEYDAATKPKEGRWGEAEKALQDQIRFAANEGYL